MSDSELITYILKNICDFSVYKPTPNHYTHNPCFYTTNAVDFRPTEETYESLIAKAEKVKENKNNYDKYVAQLKDGKISKECLIFIKDYIKIPQTNETLVSIPHHNDIDRYINETIEKIELQSSLLKSLLKYGEVISKINEIIK